MLSFGIVCALIATASAGKIHFPLDIKSFNKFCAKKKAKSSKTHP